MRNEESLGCIGSAHDKRRSGTQGIGRFRYRYLNEAARIRGYMGFELGTEARTMKKDAVRAG